ncbi:hypothetical protein AVEN_37072-1 [Araneus ventricosus]|uniref:Uncharacterized protein n=1 Tax=Araneus ventricosus TaxID=182803 RepID=A0A4Y2VYE4_ARAVE|nr:hypothetical protein AVEN_37072-1 [Araneus ventricosus]
MDYLHTPFQRVAITTPIRVQVFWSLVLHGDIRRKLKGCEKLPLVAFNSIECELPGIDPTNLSYVQKCLLDLFTAISSRVVSSNLAKSQPGALNLVSWLTTANRN